MKKMIITPPDGYEVDKEKSTFELIIFKPIKKELPKRWKDLKEINGFYVDVLSKIMNTAETPTEDQNQNVFRTEGQAKAAIALAKLSHLIYIYNDGWTPDYTNGNYGFAIGFFMGKIIKIECQGSSYFLTFKTEALRDEFLLHFEELILEAKPLL
jgi:hypothetical protein